MIRGRADGFAFVLVPGRAMGEDRAACADEPAWTAAPRRWAHLERDHACREDRVPQGRLPTPIRPRRDDLQSFHPLERPWHLVDDPRRSRPLQILWFHEGQRPHDPAGTSRGERFSRHTPMFVRYIMIYRRRNKPAAGSVCPASPSSASCRGVVGQCSGRASAVAYGLRIRGHRRSCGGAVDSRRSVVAASLCRRPAMATCSLRLTWLSMSVSYRVVVLEGSSRAPTAMAAG